MPGHKALDVVDDVIRDLDMVVYRLERAPGTPDQVRGERDEVRRELERLRDRLAEILAQV